MIYKRSEHLVVGDSAQQVRLGLFVHTLTLSSSFASYVLSLPIFDHCPSGDLLSLLAEPDIYVDTLHVHSSLSTITSRKHFETI